MKKILKMDINFINFHFCLSTCIHNLIYHFSCQLPLMVGQIYDDWPDEAICIMA